MSPVDKDGVVELQIPVGHERSPLGEKVESDYEMKPKTAQDDDDMQRLGKTQQLSVPSHFICHRQRDCTHKYSEPSTPCQFWG